MGSKSNSVVVNSSFSNHLNPTCAVNDIFTNHMSVSYANNPSIETQFIDCG